MAVEIRQYTVTVPAGTLATAPIDQPMAFPPREVDALQIVVPPGPSGLVGFRVLVGGVPVIPYDSDDWVITSGENITWPLQSYPNSGAWSVQAYNTGTVDHAVYFRFLLSLAVAGGTTPPAMIDNADIAPATVGLTSGIA